MINIIIYRLIFLICVIISASCTGGIVSSTNFPTSSEIPSSGYYYYLPKGKLRVLIYHPTDKYPCPNILDTKSLLISPPSSTEPPKGEPKSLSQTGDEFCLITELLFEPDTDNYFFLDVNYSSMSNDNVTLMFNSKGFIKKIKTDVTDQTGAVIVKLAEIAAQAAVFFSTGFGPIGSFETKELPKKIPFPEIFDITIDPSDPIDYCRLFVGLQKYKLNVFVEPPSQFIKSGLVDRIYSYGEDSVGRIKNDCNNMLNNPKSFHHVSDAKRGCVNRDKGICYRPVVPYTLKLKSQDLENRVIVERTLLIPNKAPLMSIDITRAALVQKITEVDFDNNGILNQVSINKPSQTLAVVTLPLTILKALVGIPAELLTIKVKQSTNIKNITEADLAALKAQIEIFKLQNELKSTGSNE